MRHPPNPLFTRPGGHSAKNARQAGAPNNLHGSGENPMVGTNLTPDTTGVATLQEHLYHQAEHFVVFDHSRGSVRVDFARLATVVAEIVTAHISAVTAVNDEFARQIVILDADAATGRAERAGLWHLLKAQTRIVGALRARVRHYREVATRQDAAVGRRGREVRAGLGAPSAVGPSCVELAAELWPELGDAGRDAERGVA